MSRALPVEPWSVWWIDFDPVEGNEQAGRRPAVVVSSGFQLAVTAGMLLTVLPMTTRLRVGWEHHVEVKVRGKPVNYVMTEQVRTLSHTRLAGHRPLIARLNPEQIRDIRAAFRQMLDL